MRRLIIAAGILLLAIKPARAGEDLKYPVSSIPDSLKNNAKAVVRNYDQQFEFQGIGKGTFTVSYALTILNENGLDESAITIPYSQKLHRVHNIRGAVYDASGKKVENISADKIIDQSMISGYSLFEDSRMKYFQPKTLNYPLTVEYSFVIEYDGLLDIPEWDPVMDYNVSIESSKFRIICPNTVTFRYKERNIRSKPVINKTETATTYEWSIAGMVAYVPEPFSGPTDNYMPVVYLAPDKFEIEGYQGDMGSWADFGKWINQLNAGKNQLSPETVTLLREKVKDCKTDYERAKVVYEYMQQKTRYLNITIGIGGWQTLPAETVDRLGYGDCKALTYYTMSLLNAVGIKSYYSWIKSGSGASEVDPSFTANMFNHMILCVPFEKDSLWLECTDQHIPFGFIGDFTDDRNALLITEDGGKIAHTRSYKPSENCIDRSTVVTLGPTGDAGIVSKTKYRGIKYSDNVDLLLAGTEDKKRMILDNINLPGTELIKFNYSEERSQVPVLNENLEFGVMRYATLSGPRMLVAVVPLDRQREVPKKVSNRKSNVVIRRTALSVDTVTVVIPEGYTVESTPSEIKSESAFGSYSLKVLKVDDKKLQCIRRVELRKGVHPASTYNDLIDFFKRMAVADNTKISLKKPV